MPKAQPATLRHYSVAILSVTLALLLTLLLNSLLHSTVWALFYAAVVISIWYGGFGPGLLATILSSLILNHLLLRANSLEHFVRLAVFILVSLLISSLTVALRSAKQRAEMAMVKLKASEARYRRLIDTATEGICTLDAEGRINYVNQRTTQMLGYSVGEMLGRSIFDFMDSASRLEVQQQLERRQQGTAQQRDLRLCCQDGSALWTIVSTNPILNETGEFLGTLAMIADVTDRKRVEEERAELLVREQTARESAEVANRIKDEFLSILSHELRTPLASMLLWVELLRSGNLNPATTTSALETIERNTKSQIQLIDALLDISRIIAGKLYLSVEPVELIPLIEATIDLIRPSAALKGIQIQTVLDSSVALVFGDPVRLQQILWNLLSNAVKFTSTGGRVEVRLTCTDSYAKIVVRDTGIGISAEFLPYVFDRFRQADNKTTRPEHGLGLGLAIVRHLVELHGGTINAYSRGEGQGATFTVTLPLAAFTSETIDQECLDSKIEESSRFDDLPRLDGLLVLVVDDEADVREAIALMLKQCGAEVLAVASTGEALKILAKEAGRRPDVLLCDIRMPDDDGYTLIRRVRALETERGGRILAAAVTAYAKEEDRSQALSAGFQLHLSKPINPAHLVAAVANLVEQARKAGEMK
jgi:PAS domain S-box-containing protein